MLSRLCESAGLSGDDASSGEDEEIDTDDGDEEETAPIVTAPEVLQVERASVAIAIVAASEFWLCRSESTTGHKN